MKPVSTLYPRLARSGFYAAAPPILSIAIISAAQKFCRETRLVRSESEPTSLVAGTSIYRPDFGTGLACEQIDSVSLASGGSTYLLEPTTFDELNRANRLWRAESGKPSKYVFDGLNMTLYSSPSASGAVLSVFASTTPADDATEMEDVLIDIWGDTICAGAKCELISMFPGPWTATMGPQYQSFSLEFAQGISRADIGEFTRNSGRTKRLRFTR